MEKLRLTKLWVLAAGPLQGEMQVYNLDKLLQRAQEIAREAHAGVKRNISNEDYINHPQRVSDSFPNNTLLQIAGWLHDVVEDNPEWTLERLRAEGFPDSVLNIVDAVTRRKAQGESYADFIRRIKGHSKDAVALKLADLNDNLRDLPQDHGLRRRYLNALDELNS